MERYIRKFTENIEENAIDKIKDFFNKNENYQKMLRLGINDITKINLPWKDVTEKFYICVKTFPNTFIFDEMGKFIEIVSDKLVIRKTGDKQIGTLLRKM